MEDKIKVYVQVDSNNVITQIESSISSNYIDFTTGWIQIDEGNGEKYAHAQNYYLENKLMDSQGKYNYKLVDNKPIELTEEEKLFPTKAPESSEAEKQAELINNLILDNLNMQAQLDELIANGLGGN